MARILSWSRAGFGFAQVPAMRTSLVQRPAVTLSVQNFYSMFYEDGAGQIVASDGVTWPMTAADCTACEAVLAELDGFSTAPADQCYGHDAAGNYLGLVPLGQEHERMAMPLPDGRTWQKQANGMWSPVLDVAAHQQDAVARIDSAASQARARYVTQIPGQMAVYIEKAQQATTFLADTTKTPGPYVQAEATATGVDAVTAANTIVSMADTWNVKGPAIEQARRAGKISVQAATTADAVAAALATAISNLNAI